jgi:hypothetical protein
VQIEGAGDPDRLDQRLQFRGIGVPERNELQFRAPLRGGDLVGDHLAERGAARFDEAAERPAKRLAQEQVGERCRHQREDDGHGT